MKKSTEERIKELEKKNKWQKNRSKEGHTQRLNKTLEIAKRRRGL